MIAHLDDVPYPFNSSTSSRDEVGGDCTGEISLMAEVIHLQEHVAMLKCNIVTVGVGAVGIEYSPAPHGFPVLNLVLFTSIHG